MSEPERVTREILRTRGWQQGAMDDMLWRWPDWQEYSHVWTADACVIEEEYNRRLRAERERVVGLVEAYYDHIMSQSLIAAIRDGRTA